VLELDSGTCTLLSLSNRMNQIIGLSVCTLDTCNQESCMGFATSYSRASRCEWTLRDRIGRAEFSARCKRIMGGEDGLNEYRVG
jgi:hypothetical protein